MATLHEDVALALAHGFDHRLGNLALALVHRLNVLQDVSIACRLCGGLRIVLQVLAEGGQRIRSQWYLMAPGLAMSIKSAPVRPLR